MRIDNDWNVYKISPDREHDIFLGHLDLPHDAMIHEQRKNENLTGKNSAYFDGGDYLYKKKLIIDNKWSKIYLVFEGMYQKGIIYLNDQEIGRCDYGYVDTILEISNYVKMGENDLQVKVENHNQPNSRWYSGSGIFRHVNIFLLGEKHIVFNSFKIMTMDYKTGLVNVKYNLSEPGTSLLEVMDASGKTVASSSSDSDKVNLNLIIPEVKLWDDSNPYLYTFKVTFFNHDEEIITGIRQMELSTEKGLLINGKKVLLKGCCIHHDLGLLGAADNDFASFRKVKLLKDIGYNALRSAHNPCSRALLEACDKLGMYVIDEYADSWYIHKTKYDVADHVLNNWKDDLNKIVDKDYNHPSVIMYSTGNEVAETSEKKGIQLVNDFDTFLHEKDKTRFTTCGINVFFNALYSVGLGQYSDKKADEEIKKKKKKASGSEFFNNLAGLLGAQFMKTMAKLPLVDLKTKDAFAKMDISGYNYGIKRYKHDFKKYPNRFIVGSETFISDAGQFMAEAKKYPRLLGDFVWCGMDYLGECGIGAMINKDKIKISDDKNWILADTGAIDILGDETSQSDYTKVAFRKEIIRLGIVSPYDYRNKHTPSSWRFTRSMHSYAFNGEEGNVTIGEVYFNSPVAEIYLNNQLIRKFIYTDSCFKRFKFKYIKGTIKAVAKDENGNILGEDVLSSASEKTMLSSYSESASIRKDELGYIHVGIYDDNGILKPLSDTRVNIESIENASFIAFSSAVPYNPDLFFNKETNTYNGRALLIVKPLSFNPIKVIFSSIYGSCETNIKIEK